MTSHLSFAERRIIAALLQRKLSVAQIAVQLGRHRSTVHREIRRNFWHDPDVPMANGYWHVNAQQLATARRSRQRKLFRHEALRMDMIARRLTEETRPVVVAAPDYLDRAGRPVRPEDLAGHPCLGYRMHSAGRVMPWRFVGPTGEVMFRDATTMVFNDGALLRQAAIRGLGLTCLWHHMVAEDLETGRLESVLHDRIGPLPGFYLYYPSREVSPAMSIFAEALVAWCRRPRTP
ncbi:LysR substrate-binding domain-containing protein [Paracoccus sp. TOH]|uniref:LysR substrate-binding domain-containing protein n=1 Tax=Paracoccus sp. TOH TaxID=1263728 RepID=UPI0025AEF3E1|nr:LysR substrate-binding domain-containing protein [Paracoccus sp. TOH]